MGKENSYGQDYQRINNHFVFLKIYFPVAMDTGHLHVRFIKEKFYISLRKKKTGKITGIPENSDHQK